MRELPILACDSVAKNLWEGKQTQHRVPMKPQPSEGWNPDLYAWQEPGHKWGAWSENQEFHKAPWSVGDILYVREACKRDTYLVSGVRYRSDGTFIPLAKIPNWREADLAKKHAFYIRKGWTGNRNTLKAVARTRLLVNRVWCERIQDISEEDAKAEGVGCESHLAWGHGGEGDGMSKWAVDHGHYYGFRDLWISLYGEESWNSNQWVWACEFEKLPG